MNRTKAPLTGCIFWVGLLIIISCGLCVLAKVGTVLSHQKISDSEGSFAGAIDSYDYFGCSAAWIGYLDSDFNADIAVGAYKDDDGGGSRGAVWVLFLNSDGTVKSYQKICDTEGGFTGILNNNDYFGISADGIDDVDGDFVPDLAVGAYMDDDGGTDRGAVWVLFLNEDGTVKSHQKISDTAGNFTGELDSYDSFGSSVAYLGDLDWDSAIDIAVGAQEDDDGGSNRGAVWILFLNADGTVKSHQKISDTTGNFTGVLDSFDSFGTSVTALGDMDGDFVTEIAVGAINDDDGGSDRGAVWILFLDPNGMVKSHQKISDTEGGFTGTLDDGDQFGSSLTLLGDLNRDGSPDIAVGSQEDDDGGSGRGAVWILFLDPNGMVKGHQKISDTEGDFSGTLGNGAFFGSSVAAIPDLDGDRVTDLVVGSMGDADGGAGTGAVWTLFLYACSFDIQGDINYDCKVDFEDFALMSQNWLLDCDATPAEAACIPTY